MVWYGIVWYSMVWYGVAWRGVAWYGMVWYGMVWYGIISSRAVIRLLGATLILTKGTLALSIGSTGEPLLRRTVAVFVQPSAAAQSNGVHKVLFL